MKLPRKHIILPLGILLLLVLLLMPRSAKFNYDYRKGGAWEYDDLVAEFDFPILKTEDELQAERLQSKVEVIPYYVCDLDAEARHIDTVMTMWYRPLSRGYRLSADFARYLEQAFETGIIADDDPLLEKAQERPEVVYLERGKRRTVSSVDPSASAPFEMVPTSNIMTTEQARRWICRELAIQYRDSLYLESILRNSGLLDQVVPNIHYDAVMTELVGTEGAREVSPTVGIVHFGDRIVQRGELVTDDVFRMLESYRHEFESRMGSLSAGGSEWLGRTIIALVLVLLFYFCILYTNPKILDEPGRFIYLVLVFTLATLVTFFVESSQPRLLYMVPFTLTTLYLISFFKKRVVLPVYIVSLLPLLLFAHNGLELFVIYLVSGVVTIYVFGFFSRGWKQFLTALISFLTVAAVFTGYRLYLGNLDSMPQILLMLFIGALLSVAGYPLIYLFEIVFNLVSSSRLMELCDTNANRLLRDLAEKAPGTFQHSLQVMNMADAAIRQIGGDVLLVRAGALYHDIGKMQNPRCFIENEGQYPGMPPYHDGLSPHDSAVQIVRHVPDGMELAEKHHLPSVVKDFILTHHGTACARYFYTQYLNAGGSPDKASDFFYDGQKPRTREQTVLMICDSVEAASRTMKDYSQASCDELVTKIVQSKVADGQLRESEISIRDLDLVQDFLKGYLSQLYHARIEYPKLNKKMIKNK